MPEAQGVGLERGKEGWREGGKEGRRERSLRRRDETGTFLDL
jgi:hypothetical protein